MGEQGRHARWLSRGNAAFTGRPLRSTVAGEGGTDGRRARQRQDEDDQLWILDVNGAPLVIDASPSRNLPRPSAPADRWSRSRSSHDPVNAAFDAADESFGCWDGGKRMRSGRNDGDELPAPPTATPTLTAPSEAPSTATPSASFGSDRGADRGGYPHRETVRPGTVATMASVRASPDARSRAPTTPFVSRLSCSTAGRWPRRWRSPSLPPAPSRRTG